MTKKKKKRKQSRQSSFPDIMRDVRFVQPDDTFRYQCSCCGDCCRDVGDAIMLESLDAYRLARYLKESGHDVNGPEDVFLQYAHPLSLDAKTGYPIFLLNTDGPRNACVFLEDNRCAVQPAKPRACRMYPMSAGPKDDGSGFEYAIVSQKNHHFAGPELRAGDWMDANLSEEDRAFVTLDAASLKELAPLIIMLKRLGAGQDEILRPLIWFRYFCFDPDEDFLPRYERNQDSLKNVLTEMLERRLR